MGITNFTKLIECFHGEDREQWNEAYDSVLIDLQSELYVAIDRCFPLHDRFDEECERRFFEDVSATVQKRLADIILDLFKKCSRRSDEEITVVCSFDGRGVPMKWPTQRNRRLQTRFSGKNLYRVSLFGNNLLSARIRDDLVRALKTGNFHDRLRGSGSRRHHLPKYIRYVVSGCDVDGEGEHKMFHLAEALGLKYPVFVSVDNDAIVLALARLDRYECVQLDNKRDLYNLTNFARDILRVPVDALVFVSLLFGNDFVPPVVTLQDNNCLDVRECLSKAWEDMMETGEDREKDRRRWIPVLHHRFLAAGMTDRMRYDKEPTRSPTDLETVAVRFWTTCLWTLDYYTRRDFSQKWAKNEIYDAFDRDGLLAVLTRIELAKETFEKSLVLYEKNEIPHEDVTAERRVFDDAASLEKISRFLIPNGPDEGSCHDIKIATLKRRATEPIAT